MTDQVWCSFSATSPLSLFIPPFRCSSLKPFSSCFLSSFYPEETKSRSWLTAKREWMLQLPHPWAHLAADWHPDAFLPRESTGAHDGCASSQRTISIRTRHWRLHYPALTFSQVHREQYYLDLQTQRLLKHADISWLNVMLPPIKRLPRLQSFFQMQTFPSSHARPYARGKRATPFLNTDYRVLWWLGRLRIPCCHCCGVGWPLAWELLHVMNVAKKKKKSWL